MNMTTLFIALDLLFFFLYHGWSSNHYAALKILLLGLGFFGCIQSILGHRKPIAFLASTLGLLASLCAYEISFRSEEALGVPLQAAGALDHLMYDPSTRQIFFSQLTSHTWQIVSVALCSVPLLVIIYRLIARAPALNPIYIRSVSGCAILVSLAIGIWSPSTFRGDTRLLFYFGWPPVINLGGSDVYREEAAARDELARQTYNGSPKDPATIVLIFADSLRADHLSLYGCNRETTPYLSSLYAEGKLKKVEWTFSSCSESFCGVASTLSSKPFYRISERSLKVNELLQRAG